MPDIFDKISQPAEENEIDDEITDFDQVAPIIQYFESAYNPKASNVNKNKSLDTGLYQINDVHIAPNNDQSPLRQKIDTVFVEAGIDPSLPIEKKREALTDPKLNHMVAKVIFDEKGLDAWATATKVKEYIKTKGYEPPQVKGVAPVDTSDIFDEIDIFDQIETPKVPTPLKPVVGVERVPTGEEGQPNKRGTMFGQVFETPEVVAEATGIPEEEMTRSDKDVREYVQSQRFYANQRRIPRIGTEESPEAAMARKMGAIATEIETNPFINPLAPTIQSTAGVAAGLRRAGEGLGDIASVYGDWRDAEKAYSEGRIQEAREKAKAVIVKPGKGILKTALGVAEAGLSGMMTATPAANILFSAAGKAVPESMELISPVTTLTKPTTELGQLAAMLGDVVYQGAGLKAVRGLAPKAVSVPKETASSGLLDMRRQNEARYEQLKREGRLLPDRTPTFMESPEGMIPVTGEPPSRVARVAGEERRMGEQIFADAEARNAAKAKLESGLQRKLSDAEFEAKLAERKEYSEPARLVTPEGSSEVLPARLYTPEGKPIPSEPVRSARAPLTEPQLPVYPFEGQNVEIPPSFRAKMRTRLELSGEKREDLAKLSDQELVARYRDRGLDVEAPLSEAPISRGGDMSVRGQANAEQIQQIGKGKIKGRIKPGDLKAVVSPAMYAVAELSDLDEETKNAIKVGAVFAGLGLAGAKFMRGKNLVGVFERGGKYVAAVKDRVLGEFKTQDEALQYASDAAKSSDVIVSPFYDKTIKDIGEASQIRQSDAYKTQQKTLNDIATRFNVKVNAIDETVGGYKMDSGKEITEVSNIVRLKTDNLDVAERVAAVAGALSPEVQEATIAAKYLPQSAKNATAHEISIPVKDPTKAIQTLKDNGFTDYTMNESTGNITILDFAKGEDPQFRKNLEKLMTDLKTKEVINGEAKQHNIESRYITAGDRGEILRTARTEEGLRPSGGNLRGLYEEANAANQKFLETKDPRLKYAKRDLGDGKVIYESKGAPLGRNDTPVVEVTKPDGKVTYEVRHPQRPKNLEPQKFETFAEAETRAREIDKQIKDQVKRGGDFLGGILGSQGLPKNAYGIAGAAMGIDVDDEGKVKIDPTRFALGILGGIALANIRINPSVRAKLAKAIGKDPAKMTDQQIVDEYQKLAGTKKIAVRQPNEKLYAENVKVDKFSDPALTTEVVAGVSEVDLANARRNLSDKQIDKLAEMQGKLIQDIRDGKVPDTRAYLAEEIRAISSEAERVIAGNKGRKFTDLTAEDASVINVFRAYLSAAYESGLAQREFGRKVSPELANTLKMLDPRLTPLENLSPGVMEMLAEFGAAMKLWTGSSVVRSLFGNATMRTLRPFEHMASVGFNRLLAAMSKNPRDRFAEELWSRDVVRRANTKDAFKSAWDILRADDEAIKKNLFLTQEGYSTEGAIPGKAGTVIRTSLRAQGAVDVIFRQPMADMILKDLSIREAFKSAKRGEKHADIMKRAQTIYDNPPESMKVKSDDMARYWTFQNRGGQIMMAANELRSHPTARLVVPFFNTSANLFKAGYARTPMATLTPSFAQAVWEAVSKKTPETLTRNQKALGKMTGRDFTPGQAGELSDALSKMTTGAAVMYGTSQLVDKVLEGNITGDYPRDRNEAEAWKIQGKTANSVKIGGYWYNYQGYEPMSTFLSTLAAYNDAREHNQDLATSVLRGYKALVSSVFESPMMTTFKSVNDAFAEENTGDVQKTIKAGARFVTGMAIPGFVRQSAAIVDGRIPETRGFAETITSAVPGATKSLNAKIDLFGREMEYDKPWLRLLGINLSKEATDRVSKEFAELGESPLPPASFYESIKLSDEQKRKLQIASGAQLYSIIDKILISAGDGWKNLSKEIRSEEINKIKNEILDAQRQMLFPKIKVKGQISKQYVIPEEERKEWMELVGE